MIRSTVLMAVAALAVQPCAAQAQEFATSTAATQAIYEAAMSGLDWTDERDFVSAEHGLIARFADPVIRGPSGNVIWTFPDYAAMRHAPPPQAVHPILWRQSRLNAANGLFEVVPGVYQLRGFDLANMTVIEGRDGIIVVDPLTSVEVARAGLELYFQHRPRRPVTAVIYTHSHMDHYGGVRGVVDEVDVTTGRVRIIAPNGFLREAVSENVTAGNAMLRRTIYYSGVMVPPAQRGSLGAGLGPGVSNGTQSFIAPTEEVPEAGGTLMIDGVEFQFRSASQTEAPSEFVFYLPQFGVLDVAEVAVHTVHNLLTPRGAQVRDAARWAVVIDGMLDEFGPTAQVMIGSHHWPSFGSAAIGEHLTAQRDFYQFTHDRALHLANTGLTMDEIAAQIELPPTLARQWTLQDYYGTLGSAGRAVFQRYLGWYDGNPANLDRLPLAESAPRVIAYMGGADAVLERARVDFAGGDYRWVAEVLNQLIFAEPGNAAARELQAETLTQLGYQQISATWRNVYLTAARELREGVVPIPVAARSNDFVSQMTAQMLFDYAGVALSPDRSTGVSLALVVDVAGATGPLLVEVQDQVLRYRSATASDVTATRISLAKPLLDALLSRRIDAAAAIAAGQLQVAGNSEDVVDFFQLFDVFAPSFDLVTP